MAWNEAERVYESELHGDLDGVLAAAASFFESGAAESYQTGPVLATRARALLARDRLDEALADAERVIAGLREQGEDAQTASYLLVAASRVLDAAGRREEAEALLAAALSTTAQELTHDLPLYLVELDRGDAYLAVTKGQTGFLWLAGGRAAAAGDEKRPRVRARQRRSGRSHDGRSRIERWRWTR